MKTGCKVEGGGLRSEVGGLRSEVGGRRSEGGSRRSEVGRRRFRRSAPFLFGEPLFKTDPRERHNHFLIAE